MNKVLNIDIAGQVFRLDELAFANLTTYLEQIRKQLRGFDGADEILKDIELRIAELLYGFSRNGKAITAGQVEEIIEQVGLIDSDDEIEEETTRKSYRDVDNKILGGVCAGLATRFQVPVIVLRLIFIALTVVAGLGAVLYLIFWVSLESNVSRNAALAAMGKPRTAKQLALYDDREKPKPVVSFLSSLQRIIFLPVSIIGALLAVIGGHFYRRRKNYKTAFKYSFTLFLAFLSVFVIAVFFALENDRFVPWFFEIVIGVSIAYLLVLAWAMYIRRYFLTYSNFAIARELKLGAAAPITIIAIAFAFLFINLERDRQVVARDFPVIGSSISVVYGYQQHEGDYSGHPRVVFKTKPQGDDRLTVSLDYSAAGRTLDIASENLQGINYAFSFDDGVLTLDDHFTLNEGFYNRGQSVSVTIEVPQYVRVISPRSFSIRQVADNYDYISRVRANDVGGSYITRGNFFHELDEDFRNRLSANEREVLEDKFCKEFFIGQSWDCNSNLRMPVQQNRRFDLAFQSDADAIEQMRNFMSPNRSLFVSNLADVDSLVSELSVVYPVMSDFQSYVRHLMEVKSI